MAMEIDLASSLTVNILDRRVSLHEEQCFAQQSNSSPVTADWGDILSIKVINKLQDNGTAIHFHGVRQLNSCGADGVPGITQCPIAPGAEFTYYFRATQFGSSWYVDISHCLRYALTQTCSGITRISPINTAMEWSGRWFSMVLRRVITTSTWDHMR
jgi:hypothetical protein